MIARIATYLGALPPVFIDGTLYTLVLWFTFNQSYFGGDEAAKFMTPAIKFWLNWVIGSGAVCCGAIKMFRSTSYADHQKKKTGDTEFLPKP
jgi:hypothetical protein